MPIEGVALLSLGVRILFYAGALTALGHALLIAFGGRFAGLSPRIILLAAAATLLTQLARLLLANAELAGGLGSALDRDTFRWVWSAYRDQTLVLVAGASVALLGAFLRSRIMAGVGALVIAGSFGLSGHAAALPEPGLAPWILAAHVLLAGGWFVAPVLLWPRAVHSAVHIEAMEAYSRIALFAVPPVFLAGFWLAWRIAGGIEPLLTTTYGQTLMIKALAASLALGLGALNKTVITRRLRTNPTLGRRALYLTLSADAVLFLFILGCVAWVTTIAGPPSHPMSG